MLLAEVVEVSRRIGATSKRLEKIALLAALLKQLSPEEVEIAGMETGQMQILLPILPQTVLDAAVFFRLDRPIIESVPLTNDEREE